MRYRGIGKLIMLGITLVIFALQIRSNAVENLALDPDGQIENCKALSEDQLAEYFEGSMEDQAKFQMNNCKSYSDIPTP